MTSYDPAPALPTLCHDLPDNATADNLFLSNALVRFSAGEEEEGGEREAYTSVGARTFVVNIDLVMSELSNPFYSLRFVHRQLQGEGRGGRGVRGASAG